MASGHEFGELRVDLTGFSVKGSVRYPFRNPVPSEQEGVPLPEPKEVDALLPHAFAIQQRFAAEGVNILLAGGLATDVLARTYLPDHQTRPHKDIDFLAPDYILASWGYLFAELGYREAKPFTDIEEDNVRIFVNPQIGVRADLMGYRLNTPAGSRPIGLYPLMRWEKIDRSQDPLIIDPQPISLATPHGTLALASPSSLLTLKMGQRLDHEGTKARDVHVLNRLVAKGM